MDVWLGDITTLSRWWLKMVIFAEPGVGEWVKTYGRRKIEWGEDFLEEKI